MDFDYRYPEDPDCGDDEYLTEEEMDDQEETRLQREDYEKSQGY